MPALAVDLRGQSGALCARAAGGCCVGDTGILLVNFMTGARTPDAPRAAGWEWSPGYKGYLRQGTNVAAQA